MKDCAVTYQITGLLHAFIKYFQSSFSIFLSFNKPIKEIPLVLDSALYHIIANGSLVMVSYEMQLY